jgi:hypothetical protein
MEIRSSSQLGIELWLYNSCNMDLQGSLTYVHALSLGLDKGHPSLTGVLIRQVKRIGTEILVSNREVSAKGSPQNSLKLLNNEILSFFLDPLKKRNTQYKRNFNCSIRNNFKLLDITLAYHPPWWKNGLLELPICVWNFSIQSLFATSPAYSFIHTSVCSKNPGLIFCKFHFEARRAQQNEDITKSWPSPNETISFFVASMRRSQREDPVYILCYWQDCLMPHKKCLVDDNSTLVWAYLYLLMIRQFIYFRSISSPDTQQSQTQIHINTIKYDTVHHRIHCLSGDNPSILAIKTMIMS